MSFCNGLIVLQGFLGGSVSKESAYDAGNLSTIPGSGKSPGEENSDPLYLMAQMVKRLPAMRETPVQFLGREDPLEKEMAIHSSILAWKIPWMEEPDRLQSMGLQRGYSPWSHKELDMTERLHFLSSILTWENPWTGQPSRLQSKRSQESDTT